MSQVSEPDQLTTVTISRDFTVATFIVDAGRVLLLRHRSLNMWLPPGGHIEQNELPDEAAIRETLEEAGIHVELVSSPRLGVTEPRQLARPEGVQVETIRPGHEHVDLIYFARPAGDTRLRLSQREAHAIGWHSLADLEELDLTDEVRRWCVLAIQELA